MIPVQTASPQEVDIDLPRPHRKRIQETATPGDEVVLSLGTATATLLGNQGKIRENRELDTEIPLRVIETGESIKLGSLPRRIDDDIRGGHKGIGEVERVSAEVVDIHAGETGGTEPVTGVRDAEADPPRSDSPDVPPAEHRSAAAIQFCPQCGVDLRSHSDPVYCPECGTELPTQESE
ncbi:zinc ribbon domain-containing protein [Halosegnis longus]|uniref:zinc ribbon domain-containing protein n=1 Tax=Halosegnis longus TaxID=2216012 RepID=UPI0011807547|nr:MULTISPECIES: zinc ribbon domain-containing protein [Halobacteriales]